MIPDPLQMWRNAISALESSTNAVANQTMNSGDLAGAIHQLTTLTLGMQQTFEKVLGVYLKKLNLPSRAEIQQLSEVLQRVEAKLDQLTTAGAHVAAAPRPARTRQPVESPELSAAADNPAKRVRKSAT